MTPAEALRAEAGPGGPLAALAARFGAALAGRALPAHAEACRALLEDPAAAELHPFALVSAARAELHRPEAWTAQALPGLIERLAALVAQAPATAGPARDLVAGLRAYAAEDVEAAWRLMAAAGAAPGYAALRAVDDVTRPPGYMRPFPDARALAAAACPAGALVFHRRFAVAPRLAVSITADPIYAEAFAPEWLRAAARLPAGSAGLHLHLVFGGAAQPAGIASLLAAAQAAGVDLALTAEENAGWDRAYYASARFLQAPALLEAFDCPILLSDADGRLSDPQRFAAEGLPALVAQPRVAAFFNPPWRHGYLPWRRFSANAVLLPRNAAGRDFAARLRACLSEAWDPARGPLWWIDQLALETARRSLLREGWPAEAWHDFRGGIGRLVELPPGYKDAQLAAAPRIAALMAGGLTLPAALARLRRTLREAG
jgi:hypothetical protein